MIHPLEVIGEIRDPARELREQIPDVLAGYVAMQRAAIADGALPARNLWRQRQTRDRENERHSQIGSAHDPVLLKEVAPKQIGTPVIGTTSNRMMRAGYARENSRSSPIASRSLRFFG